MGSRSPEYGEKNRFKLGGAFFFGDHLNLERKTVSNLVKTFFFFFLRSLENPEKSVPFSLPVLDCTKPMMRNIKVVPGPTLGAPARWSQFGAPSQNK